MWFWRRMEKISWTDHVRNEEVLLRVNEQRNILHEIREQKANWIGYTLRRNCLLQQVIEGKVKGQIEVTGRRGRRHKKLLDDRKDRRGYCQLKEEALDRIMWRNRFGRGFGPVVWQITDDDDVNECCYYILNMELTDLALNLYISKHIYKLHKLIFLQVDKAGCLTLSCGDKALVTKRMENGKVILPLCYIFWTIQKIMK